MIVVSVKVNVEAERQQAFVERFKQVCDTERNSSGCIDYAMYQDPFDSAVFFIFEKWRTKEDFEQHVKRSPFAAFLDCIVSAEVYQAKPVQES